MSNRITLQPAFILHTRPFRDTSLLVDMLTLGYGRVHAVARSARGINSRFKGLLQPFMPLLVTWSGNAELVNLSHAEINGAPYNLSGLALVSGFYLNELLVRLLYRNDAHSELYMAYQNALIHLQQGVAIEKVLRLFEMQLLAELGYGLELQHEIDTRKTIAADDWYRFDQELGGLVKCSSARDTRVLFQGKSLLALQQRNLEASDDLQQAKRLLRLVLAPLLGDKPIKSRELLI